MNIFICAKLNYKPRNNRSESSENCFPIRSQKYHYVNCWRQRAVHKIKWNNWQFTQSRSAHANRVVSHGSSWPLIRLRRKAILRSYFVDARRLMLFMVEQVFLLMGSFSQCMIHVHNARRARMAKGWKNFVMFNFPWLSFRIFPGGLMW